MKIVHIGLPKTATTTLQKKILSYVSQIKKYEYLQHNDLRKIYKMSNYKNFFYYLPNASLKKKNNIVVSFESLVSIDGNPFFFKNSSILNKKLFGFNSHIILFIKHPQSLINSVFAQNIKSLKIQTENKFFVSKKKYQEILRKNNKIDHNYCLELLNYKKLISYYKGKFKKVTIAKIESLNELKDIKKIFDVNTKQAIKIRSMYLSKRYNLSPGKNLIKIAFLLNNILKKYNLSLFKLYKLSLVYCNKIDRTRLSNITFLRKSIKFFIHLINYRFVLDKIIFKFYTDKKYKVDTKKFEFFSIRKEINFYKKLKNVTTFG